MRKARKGQASARQDARKSALEGNDGKGDEHTGLPPLDAEAGRVASVGRAYLALYSLAVNSLWPTDCACMTVPFGALPLSGHQR